MLLLVNKNHFADRLSAKFRTMAGTGLLSEQMMDAFAAKRAIDVREATAKTPLITKEERAAHGADVLAGSATSQTPSRSSIIRKAASRGISAAELRKSPARSISTTFDSHAATTWEMATLLTDPNGALLVDVRESVLVFLPEFAKAVVLLQHFLDLYYGYASKANWSQPCIGNTSNN